jgi:hypothetical protein
METITIAVFTLAASAWLGAIVFQSAVVAPTVFVDLDEASARAFLRRLFPRFFRLGLVCGALMIASLLASVAAVGWSTTVAGLAAITAAMITLNATSLAMVPHINAARDAGETGETTFRRLHRSSVLLTIIVMLLGIAALVVIASHAATGV